MIAARQGSLHRRVFTAVLILLASFLLSSCNIFVRPTAGISYQDPIDRWFGNPGSGFLCPEPIPDFPPLTFDLNTAVLITPPEEGVLDFGDYDSSADTTNGTMPAGDSDHSRFAGPYDINMEIPEGGDLNNHQTHVEGNGSFPDQLELQLPDSMITVMGSPPWVNVSGPFQSDGNFIAAGQGNVAGRSDVTVSFTGTLTDLGLTGSYELGLEGELPGGSILYTVNGQKALVQGTIISEGYDAAAGVSTQWVDLDGDGQADVIRTFDADGKFIDEKALDLNGVVTFAHFDASTGVEWKWVDTNGDGKPDVKRRYDHDGNLIEEQTITGTVTSAVFDSSTGITTEQVDTNGDGKPDTERKYDRDGKLIEERSLEPKTTGTVISEGFDSATGLTTQWVDLDGDGRQDVIRQLDQDGKLVHEYTLDLGGVVTGTSFDASTGAEIKYVDSDGDGKPDVVRRYDRDGFLLYERALNGTLIETDFNSESGVTTEWIDLDGDGRPDVIRTFDREDRLIEEQDVSQDNTGQAIGQSVDQTTGNTTYWVDTDLDAQADLELECDVNGGVISENMIQIAPVGLIGFLSSFSFLPICWGIFLSLVTMAGVMLVSSWCWGGPSEADLYLMLRQYLHTLNDSGRGNEIQEFLIGLKAQLLKWEEGGLLANIARSKSLEVLTQYASTWPQVHGKTMAIDKIMDAFETLIDSLQAMAIFSFALELIVSLLGTKLPGWIGAAKALAQMANLKKILEMLEIYEKIDNIKGKKEQLDAILDKINELKEIEGQIPGTDDSIGMQDIQTPTETAGPRGQLARLFTGIITHPVSLVRGCSPVILITTVLGLLGFMALVLFAMFGGFRRSISSVEITPIVEEAEVAVLVGENLELEEVAPTAIPTAEPTALMPTQSALSIMLNFGPFTEQQKAHIAIAYALDPEGDWIYSIMLEIINHPLAPTDIRGHVSAWLILNHNATGIFFNNSLFPCDSEIEGGIVVCTEPAQPMPEGKILMLVMQLAEAIPLQDPDHFYTYAAVFDADGDPSNNFQFNPPYNWDYFQNTDRWYSLDWDPGLAEWFLSVSDVAQQLYIAPSKARAVIYGDVIVFFIPAEEFSVEQPGFRLTAFGHDGSFALEKSSGDVTGADPTEPLIIPDTAPISIEE